MLQSSHHPNVRNLVHYATRPSTSQQKQRLKHASAQVRLLFTAVLDIPFLIQLVMCIIVMTHGGMGYAADFHVERYLRESFVPRLAPISREMILNYVGQRVLKCELTPFTSCYDTNSTSIILLVPRSY